MKLFTRYNRVNLLATVIVFLLSGISFYFLLRYVLVDQVDEDLKIEQHEIETYALQYKRLPEVIAVKDQQISYKEVKQDGGKRIFHTLDLYDAIEKENNDFRQLVFYLQIGKQNWQVSVSKSLEGTDNIIQSVVSITLITILLILAVSFFINRLLLKKLWQPFYDTLAAIRKFELGKKEQLSFPVTGIDEFNFMNETLAQATKKADRDYQHLKEFTENASHELQTPLAIIQSKLDVLIQDEYLSEPQSRAVHAAYEAIQRLSRLNQGLLLLTKIENGQFRGTSRINLASKLTEKIEQFREMALAKNIRIKDLLQPAFHAGIQPELAELLLNNLFSNAIKYNYPGGDIKVETSMDTLAISNSSASAALDQSRLFRRFAGSGAANEGVGLGLAIVQQAAAAAGFVVKYEYKDERHYFVLFQNPS